MPTKHILINGDCRQMSLIPNESVHLIVTSPPYWQLKDYGNKSQIGFNDTYEQYINNLNLVWQECYRILKSGCRLCINIGDQFARATYYGRYKVVSIHSEIIRFCETIGLDYMGSIIWQKPTTMHTTGGAKVMGSYPYPRGGIVKIDYEHILLFKKQGREVPSKSEQRSASALTDEEWKYIRKHPQIGADILSKSHQLSELKNIVLCHHERYDGKGYPRRIAGEDIPLTARILCVADSFDAMTSIRCYKKAFPVKVAREKLLQDAGKQFDPELVRKFVECLDNGKITLVKAEEE